VKRIRRLLLEIEKRKVQSQAAQIPRQRQQGRNRKPLVSNGRLAPEDVEREIAEQGRDKGGGAGGEEVYVKATGRAIERVLRVGVHFQGESDCTVRVEMGSVMAVDDIEVRNNEEDKEGEGGSNVHEELNDDEVPETRVRMVSSVTVAVGLR
jgi:ribonuclease P/MRP protein subunit POP7